MQRIMLRRAVGCALFTGIAVALGACGGGGASDPMATAPAQSQTQMSLLLSDASSDD